MDAGEGKNDSDERLKYKPDQKEFHFKEYDSLKAEITALVEHSRKLEIYALGGMAAFYAWWFLRANPENGNATLAVDEKALLLPVLIAVMGAFRSLAVALRIDQIAKYLVKLEDVFALEGLGWERTLAGPNPRGNSPSVVKRSPFKSSGSVYWTLLLVVTLVAPLTLI